MDNINDSLLRGSVTFCTKRAIDLGQFLTDQSPMRAAKSNLVQIFAWKKFISIFVFYYRHWYIQVHFKIKYILCQITNQPSIFFKAFAFFKATEPQ